jgi:hypothetical protein
MGGTITVGFQLPLLTLILIEDPISLDYRFTTPCLISMIIATPWNIIPGVLVAIEKQGNSSKKKVQCLWRAEPFAEPRRGARRIRAIGRRHIMSGENTHKARERKRLGALHRRGLLVVSLVLALVSLGCITFTMLTEVVRNEDGTHQVSLAIDLQMDHGVAQAVRKHKNFTGSIWGGLGDNAREAGWEVQEEGDRIVLARTFESLEDLDAAASMISSLFGGDGIQLVQNLQVIMDDSDPSVIKYRFSATVYVPEAEIQLDSISVTLDSEGLKVVEVTPEPDTVPLFEAVKEAGPSEFVVVVTLPGEIQEALIHGYPGGEIVPPNQVRFTLHGDSPGTYVLEAVSYFTGQPPTPTPTRTTTPTPLTEEEAEHALGLALSGTKVSEELLQGLAGRENWERAMDASRAARHEYRVRIGKWEQQTELEEAVEDALAVAALCAALDDAEGNPLFPSMRRSMQVIIKLAARATYDPEAQVALRRFINLLGGMDIRAWESGKGGEP